MAKKKLNSIVWPNIPNDVYYLDADKVEYDDTETYSEGSVGDALQNKANIDGSYENLTAGNAEQIVTDIRANDQTPYLFRTSGGSVDIGDREYINGIVGGTIAWNQQVSIASIPATQTVSGVTFTNNTDGTVTVSGMATEFTHPKIGPEKTWQAHKYAVFGCPAGGSKTTYALVMRGVGADTWDLGNGAIWNAAGNTWKAICAYVQSGVTVNNLVFKPQIFDLTQMFGSTIADYIYSLEQATAGAGVAFFKSLFPKPYYAYNAGELMSVKGLVSHDMVGFNAWDEEWEGGTISTTDGTNASRNDAIRSKNFIPTLPNTTYCFKCPSGMASNNIMLFYYDADKSYISASTWSPTNMSDLTKFTFVTPTNCHYIRFIHVQTTQTYNHDICINLSWDGSEDGNYEPYQKWSYPLDSDLELRGIPKLDAGNNLYYDGDVYEPDGTVTRKYGVAELSELAWIPQAYNGVNYFFAKADSTYTKNSQAKVFGYCTLYPVVSILGGGLLTDDKTIAFDNLYYGAGYTIVVRDDSISTVDELKTALTGKGGVIYTLATPTTGSADPYTNPQIVNDFGTEEFVISNTIAVPIPVGHNTDYPVNLKAKVEMMPNSPDGDGDYIVRQTNGTNEYVSIANNATIQNILARLEALEGENNG